MKSVGYAIIGCQHAHIEIFIEQMKASGHRCYGLYEKENIELAQAISLRHGIAIVDDPSMLLLLDEVVVIASSAINNEKIDIIELCEQHNKHIMVDKPAVVNRNDLKRLQDVIDRGKIQVGMLLTERFHPAIYTLKQLIDQQQIGDIVQIGMRKPHKLNEASRPDWFFSKEQCGGILIDLLVHDYDLLTWLTGESIVKSEGYVGKNVLPQYPTFYNTVNVQVTMSDGVVMQLYADWHTPEQSWTWGDGRIFVTGTKGFAELRLSGEPDSDQQPILLLANDVQGWTQVPLIEPELTISADFIARVKGEGAMLNHEQIMNASQAVIEADEQVSYVVTPLKGEQL